MPQNQFSPKDRCHLRDLDKPSFLIISFQLICVKLGILSAETSLGETTFLFSLWSKHQARQSESHDTWKSE